MLTGPPPPHLPTVGPGDEPREKLDLLAYFGQRPPGVLHCTTKFCNYGKAPGAEEYALQDVSAPAWPPRLRVGSGLRREPCQSVGGLGQRGLLGVWALGQHSWWPPPPPGSMLRAALSTGPSQSLDIFSCHLGSPAPQQTQVMA